MVKKHHRFLVLLFLVYVVLFISQTQASSTKIITGIVTDKNTSQTIAHATIFIEGSSMIDELELTTNENGIFEVELPAGMYQIKIQHPNYYTQEFFQSITLDENDKIEVSISLKPIVVGQIVVLEGIEFVLNNTHFQMRGRGMQDLLYLLRTNPHIIVEIGCHTDSRGDDTYNLKLSQKRANSLVENLITKGIRKKQLTAKGYGETLPLNHCTNGVRCSGKEHQENRRTEYTIVGFIDTDELTE